MKHALRSNRTFDTDVLAAGIRPPMARRSTSRYTDAFGATASNLSFEHEDL